MGPMSMLSVPFDTVQEPSIGMRASIRATLEKGSDETLLARYRKGDSAAFEILCQRHRQRRESRNHGQRALALVAVCRQH